MNRSLSLDALRGIAILLMVLSSRPSFVVALSLHAMLTAQVSLASDVVLTNIKIPADICRTERRHNLTLTTCRAGKKRDDLIIIESRAGVTLIYHPVSPFTINELANSNTAFKAVINGSYHDGEYDNAMPIGLFQVRGKKYADFLHNDMQLTHTVTFDETGKISTIDEVDTLAKKASLKPNYSYMQTGPLILNNGAIAMNFIQGSLNGMDAYKRSAIGRLNDATIVTVIATRSITLPQLAERLLRINNYAQRGLTLVNLDGGYSTASASTTLPRARYQPDKVTPIAIGLN
jgi:uncharacterized protein YigE (DUF2233 family)